jgi:hypothetical protein
MSKKYEYMVAYRHQKGSGRIFVTRGALIDSAEAVEQIERELEKRNPDRGTHAISNVVLLKEWSE